MSTLTFISVRPTEAFDASKVHEDIQYIEEDDPLSGSLVYASFEAIFRVLNIFSLKTTLRLLGIVWVSDRR